MIYVLTNGHLAIWTIYNVTYYGTLYLLHTCQVEGVEEVPTLSARIEEKQKKIDSRSSRHINYTSIHSTSERQLPKGVTGACHVELQEKESTFYC